MALSRESLDDEFSNKDNALRLATVADQVTRNVSNHVLLNDLVAYNDTAEATARWKLEAAWAWEPYSEEQNPVHVKPSFNSECAVTLTVQRRGDIGKKSQLDDSASRPVACVASFLQVLVPY